MYKESFNVLIFNNSKNISQSYLKSSTLSKVKRPLLISLPNEKKKNLAKLKTFADDNLTVIQLMELENIMGTKENVDFQLFFLLPQCFKKYK